VLARIAARVCAGEGVSGEAELSLLYCDDTFIAALNRQYRGKNKPTDVLSFEQESPRPDGVRMLGDIVVSMDTVARQCDGDPARMRDEVRLLFCHGLLHLLGYDHATRRERAAMQRLQADYLGVDLEAAWRDQEHAPAGRRASRGRRETEPPIGQ
jgi:probable rRNA maturation factor